jgi:hypothetical protein
LVSPIELRRAGRRVGPLFERIENDARRLVVSGHLDELPAAHPSKRETIVEEYRSWILFVDQPSLQAGA